MTLFRWTAPFALLLALAGCSPAGIVNALVPGSGYQRVEAVPYGPDPRQQLDIYIPDTPSGPKPVVMFFYGGNWQSGARGDYLFAGQALASRGFIAVIADYRVHPQVRYPDFLHDSAAATRWVLANIARHGGDPAQLHLMGHSAGAYNAAMLAYDGRWLGADRARIRSFTGLAGPYDFLPLTDPVLKTIFAPEANLRDTQPIDHADASAPRSLLVAGLDDTTVRPENSRRLAARLRANGVPVTERYHDGIGHVRLVGALAAPLRFTAPVLDEVTDFLKAK
jgi:acetyl esterase/lipase